MNETKGIIYTNITCDIVLYYTPKVNNITLRQRYTQKGPIITLSRSIEGEQIILLTSSIQLFFQVHITDRTVTCHTETFLINRYLTMLCWYTSQFDLNRPKNWSTECSYVNGSNNETKNLLSLTWYMYTIHMNDSSVTIIVVVRCSNSIYENNLPVYLDMTISISS